MHLFIKKYGSILRQMYNITTKITFTCLFQNIEDDTKNLKWYGHTVIDIFKKYTIFLISYLNVQQ